MTSRQFFSDVQNNVSRQIMFTKPPLFILPSVPKYNTIHSSTYITNYMNLCNIVYIGTYAQYIHSDWIDRIVCLHYWNSSELVVCWNVCSVHTTRWHLYSSKISQQYSLNTAGILLNTIQIQLQNTQKC